MNAAKLEISRLTAEVAELKARLSPSPSNSGKVATVLASHDDEISKWGKVFQIFYSAWIPDGAKAFKAPRPDFSWDSSERYDGDGNISSGTTAELYSCIPAHFHDYMNNHDNFPAVVREAHFCIQWVL